MQKNLKFVLVSLLVMPLFAVAQSAPSSPSPSAGFTPESTFYFLDKFGEALREFFTFSPESRARLQVTFAAERIAEIKVILETKGVDAHGLEVAQSRLKEHLTNISAVLDDEKTKGENVSALAKELDDDIDGQKDILKRAFKKEKNALKEKEALLKRNIAAARQAGNTAQADALLAELVLLKAEKDRLESNEEEHEDALEAEQEKIEREMEDKAEVEKAIRDAEKEKRETLDEATREGVTIPANAFEKFDRLLAQAKELFGRGNHQGAEQLAEQAKKSLSNVEDILHELDKAKEEALDIEEELAEKEEEMSEEGDDRADNAAKRESERLERQYQDTKKSME